MAPPREKFGLSIDKESLQDFERYYLSVAVFSGKKDPNADVLQIRLSGVRNEKWEEIGRISLYREQQGYRQMPGLPRPSTQTQQSTIEFNEKDFDTTFNKEPEENPLQ